MKNLNEFIKVEEHARVVSAWKYLPWLQRKFMRFRFQVEVLRIKTPKTLLNAFMIFMAFMFFIVTPFPRTYKKSTR